MEGGNAGFFSTSHPPGFFFCSVTVLPYPESFPSQCPLRFNEVCCTRQLDWGFDLVNFVHHSVFYRVGYCWKSMSQPYNSTLWFNAFHTFIDLCSLLSAPDLPALYFSPHSHLFAKKQEANMISSGGIRPFLFVTALAFPVSYFSVKAVNHYLGANIKNDLLNRYITTMLTASSGEVYK